MDIREAVEEFQYAKLRLSRHPQRGYRNRLTVFVAWCEQQELTLETIIARHITTFIEDMSKRPGQKGGMVRPSTVQLYVITAKSFLSWCSKVLREVS